MAKRYLLLGMAVLVLAGAVFLYLPPRPVLIASDMDVGEHVRIPAPSGFLAASLLKPTARSAKTPGVVMIVGSGSYSFRSSWKPGAFALWKGIAEAFLTKKYAVLLLEKRGVNGSEGHWQYQTFENRSEDAIAGVRYLRTRADIDPARVGICGHSQGGWVVQLAAAQFPAEVAFIVCLAGANVSVKQQIIDDQMNEWRCAGLKEAKVKKKARWLRQKLDFYGLLSHVVKIGYLSRIINYDPADVAAHIRCPILAIYGENDVLVPPGTNRRILREGLEKGRNTNFRIVTIPGGSHGFVRIPGKCPDWNKVEVRLAPEFLEAIAGWDPF
jgi:pimeloyl-ACP methyl ester carboxylesterase